LIQAFNEDVSPVFDLPVRVEYDKASPIRYKVIGRDTGRYTVWVTTNAAGDTVSDTSSYLPAHGSSHSFNTLTGVGGGDVVWVYSQQFTPWLVTPSGSSGANSVSVQPSAYYYDDQFRWAGGTGIAGFDALLPTGSSNARMLLVYLDPDTGNVLLATGSLTEFANTITGGTADIMPYMPSLIEPTDIPLAGVRLITGSSALLWPNVYDLRDYFAHSSTSGSSGGGGAPTDAEYVVMSADATLTDERVLTAGADIDIADGGAGGNATVSVSTGTFERPGHIHAHTNELPIFEDGVFQATGTIIDFGENVNVVVTGSVVFVSTIDTQGGGGGGNLLVYNNSVFQVTGTAISFDRDIEVVSTGTVAYVHLEGNSGSCYDPISNNAPSYLTTPTSDASGEAIHPSVVDSYTELGIGQTWSGHRYWMAMTPFTDGDPLVENPEILVSSDGNVWSVPSGLSNPIDTPSGTSHNADTELLLGQDSNLYCYYIEVSEGTPDIVSVNVRSSSTGTSWGSETTLFTETDSAASPTVIWDGTQYVMWYVDYGSVPFTMKKRTSNSPDSGWSSESTSTLNNTPSGFNIWNLDITKRGDTYHAIIGMWEDPKPLYFAYSSDGDTWTFTDNPILNAGAFGRWDDGFLYRATVVPIGTGYDMWYSANNDSSAWVDGHIGRAKLCLNGYDSISTDSIWENAGDIAIGTSPYTSEILSIGTNGQILLADSAESLGVRWGENPQNILTYPAIYDDGSFVSTGTVISFEDNITVESTGTSVFIKSEQCGTYQRVGESIPLNGLTGATWKVPDEVLASGSLSVFVDGLAQRPGVDYEEFFYVSGTYRYFVAPATGTVHVVMYGVPCISQVQVSINTGNIFALLDSDDELLLDSDDEQLLDSDG
jgi:hypothetical protein